MTEQNRASDFAQHFPILNTLDFFNHAAVAPISAPAAKAMHTYADQAQNQSYVKSHWYARAHEVRVAAAKLIGARGPHEIAFIPNTTTGLAQVANGLDLGQGDHVVITGVEYPANRSPWEHLARTRQMQLRQVPEHADGRIDVDQVCDAITDHTQVVSVSHVQYASGYRIDLKPISEMVHRVGGYLCVDAIQSVGVCPIDVQAMGIDFLSADGHKWMLGPEGCGLFYCHEDLCPLLEPNVVGWMNMANAMDFDHYRYDLLSDARRFEPGTWNVPGMLALGASLDLINAVGVDTIWSRVEALTAHLEAGLSRKGYRLFSPRRHAHERSGIVTFEKEGVDSRKLVGQLEQERIVIALRAGRLRASPHFYNTLVQMDRLVDALL